jgi:hypothetical protein
LLSSSSSSSSSSLLSLLLLVKVKFFPFLIEASHHQDVLGRGDAAPHLQCYQWIWAIKSLQFLRHELSCKIWSWSGYDCEESCFLGCNIRFSVSKLWMFGRRAAPTFSVEEDWGRMSLRNAGTFLSDCMASRSKRRNLSRAILFQNCSIRPSRLLPLSSESSCEGARLTGYQPT